MANKNNQSLLPNSSLRKFWESFFKAFEKKYEYDPTCSPENRLQPHFECDEKVKEFDLKYPVQETLNFVQQHLDVAGEFAMPSEPLSSFLVACNIMSQMAAKQGWTLVEDLPKVREKLFSIMATDESSTNTAQ